MQQQFQIANEVLLQALIWLGSISVSLLLTIGGLVVYVHRKFTKDNGSEHERIESSNKSEHERIEKIITDKYNEISSNLCIFRKELRDDIKGVHARIDIHLGAE